VRESDNQELRAGYVAMQTRGVWWQLDYAAIKISGEDRAEWIQGQITQDARKLESQSFLRGCICDAKGSIIAPVILTALDEFELMFVPSFLVHKIIERFSTHVIAEDVQGEIVEGYPYFTVQGPGAQDILDQAIKRGQSQHIPISAPYSSSLQSGFDVIGLSSADFEGEYMASDDLQNTLRLESGLPNDLEITTGRVFPPELGPRFESETVSYNKGCYVGQEILMRLHSRGHTNRQWQVIRSQLEPLNVHDSILDSNGTKIGEITSVGFSPLLGWLSAGFFRNDTFDKSETLITQSGTAIFKLPKAANEV